MTFGDFALPDRTEVAPTQRREAQEQIEIAAKAIEAYSKEVESC